MEFGQNLNSYTQLNAGNLAIQNNSFGGGTLFIPNIAFGINPANQAPPTSAQFPLQNNQLNLARSVAANTFNASRNQLLQTCPVTAISRTDAAGGLDPRTTAAAAITTDFTGTAYSVPFFERVNYRGAFDPNAANFWARWTHLAQRGTLAPAVR